MSTCGLLGLSFDRYVRAALRSKSPHKACMWYCVNVEWWNEGWFDLDLSFNDCNLPHLIPADMRVSLCLCLSLSLCLCFCLCLSLVLFLSLSLSLSLSCIIRSRVVPCLGEGWM